MIETTMVALAEQQLARRRELATDPTQARQARLARLAHRRHQAPERWDSHRRSGPSRAAPAAWALRIRHRFS